METFFQALVQRLLSAEKLELQSNRTAQQVSDELTQLLTLDCTAAELAVALLNSVHVVELYAGDTELALCMEQTKNKIVQQRRRLSGEFDRIELRLSGVLQQNYYFTLKHEPSAASPHVHGRDQYKNGERFVSYQGADALHRFVEDFLFFQQRGFDDETRLQCDDDRWGDNWGKQAFDVLEIIHPPADWSRYGVEVSESGKPVLEDVELFVHLQAPHQSITCHGPIDRLYVSAADGYHIYAELPSLGLAVHEVQGHDYAELLAELLAFRITEPERLSSILAQLTDSRKEQRQLGLIRLMTEIHGQNEQA